MLPAGQVLTPSVLPRNLRNGFITPFLCFSKELHPFVRQRPRETSRPQYDNDEESDREASAMSVGWVVGGTPLASSEGDNGCGSPAVGEPGGGSKMLDNVLAALLGGPGGDGVAGCQGTPINAGPAAQGAPMGEVLYGAQGTPVSAGPAAQGVPGGGGIERVAEGAPVESAWGQAGLAAWGED